MNVEGVYFPSRASASPTEDTVDMDESEGSRHDGFRRHDRPLTWTPLPKETLAGSRIEVAREQIGHFPRRTQAPRASANSVLAYAVAGSTALSETTASRNRPSGVT